MRGLHPFRIWVYIGLAAALLAVPLTRYVDNDTLLALLFGGMVVLTGCAYAEIFASVRRKTRILRAMHGQRDLFILAGVSLRGLYGGIRRDVWHSGGWTALGALLIGRLALGIALAQYLYLTHLSVPHGTLGTPINSAFRAVNYLSHNGAQIINGVWTIPLYQPLWWQRVFALAVLLVVLLAEIRLMSALGAAVYLRSRRMQRWAIPSSLAFRALAGGAALLAILGLAQVRPEYYRNGYLIRGDLACLDVRWQATPMNTIDPATCPEMIINAQVRRIAETGQVALAALLDGGTLLAANVLRANLSVTHTGEWFQYEMEYRYYETPGTYPIRPYAWPDNVVSPLLPMLRMAVGAGIAAALMVVLAGILRWFTARRYRVMPS